MKCMPDALHGRVQYPQEIKYQDTLKKGLKDQGITVRLETPLSVAGAAKGKKNISSCRECQGDCIRNQTNTD